MLGSTPEVMVPVNRLRMFGVLRQLQRGVSLYPSWIVTTQSNVRIEKRKIPDPPRVVCRGSGRVDCHECHGRGRTNHVQLTMLPKGEWPNWCWSCGGSGLGYCDRCLGT